MKIGKILMIAFIIRMNLCTNYTAFGTNPKTWGPPVGEQDESVIIGINFFRIVDYRNERPWCLHCILDVSCVHRTFLFRERSRAIDCRRNDILQEEK